MQLFYLNVIQRSHTWHTHTHTTTHTYLRKKFVVKLYFLSQDTPLYFVSPENLGEVLPLCVQKFVLLVYWKMFDRDKTRAVLFVTQFRSEFLILATAKFNKK